VSQTRFINPDALGKPPGYTHVVEATTPARIVYIAGQLGADKDGKLSANFRQQAVQTFENLKHALAAVGGRFEHVVKFTNYLIDLTYLPIFRQVRDSYLSDQNRPASTTLAISGLAREGGLLEIEAVAVLPPATAAKAASKPASKAKNKGRATKASRSRRKLCTPALRREALGYASDPVMTTASESPRHRAVSPPLRSCVLTSEAALRVWWCDAS
jgi:enamine deaminase RidA (YjgF/YER057c/UK114 family)